MKSEMVALKDLTIDVKGHYGIAASAVEPKEGLYTYLRITDIRDDGTLNISGLKCVDEPDASKYLLESNDIVFARTGASTGRNYFYDKRDGEFVYAGFLIKFSLNPKKVNPKYIKYYCQSDLYRNWIASNNTGSTRGNINAQAFANMPIILPDRKQQDFLVNVLSALDDKIALNNKINDNLERQALELFSNYQKASDKKFALQMLSKSLEEEHQGQKNLPIGMGIYRSLRQKMLVVRIRYQRKKQLQKMG